jgi:hypothetical protein
MINLVLLQSKNLTAEFTNTGGEIVIIYSRNLSSIFFLTLIVLKANHTKKFHAQRKKENNLITSVKQKEEVKDIFKIQVWFILKEVLFYSQVYHLWSCARRWVVGHA